MHVYVPKRPVTVEKAVQGQNLLSVGLVSIVNNITQRRKGLYGQIVEIKHSDKMSEIW